MASTLKRVQRHGELNDGSGRPVPHLKLTFKTGAGGERSAVLPESAVAGHPLSARRAIRAAGVEDFEPRNGVGDHPGWDAELRDALSVGGTTDNNPAGDNGPMIHTPIDVEAGTRKIADDCSAWLNSYRGTGSGDPEPLASALETFAGGLRRLQAANK